MDKTISQDRFTENYFMLLDEIFENHHGIVLDPDTSLFDTLKTVSAGEASIPVGGKCATLAAQTAHVAFYIEVTEKYITGQLSGPVDWQHIWNTVSVVTTQEWETLVENLRAAYTRLVDLLKKAASWDDDRLQGGAFAALVHSAYHLGEIRQALCTLK